jgi:RND superfamily putative drug exporter
MRGLLGRLGWYVAEHPRRFILAWAIVTLAALWFAKDADRVLEHGIGAVEGSESARVERILTQDFDHPYFPTAFVTVKAQKPLGGSAEAPAPALQAVLRDLSDSLRGQPILKGVRTALDGPEVPITPDGQATFALVGIRVATMPEAERKVLEVRKLIAPVKARHPEFELSFVSEAAINFDVEHKSFEEVSAAERYALPLALVVLVLAFGTLVAAAVPLVVGFSAVVLAMGFLFGLAHIANLSAFALSLTTMMGLGVGIDYALFVLMRFREERAAGKSIKAAAAVVVQRAGFAILSSGVTVLIGLAALLTSGLRDPQSIGTGGLIVVALSVLAALTLLPALLVVLGDRLDRLPILRTFAQRGAIPWGRLAFWVAERPIRCMVIAIALLFPLMIPAFQGRNGFPPAKFFPPGLESSIGAVRLEEIGQNGGLAPFFIAITPGGDKRATDLPVIRGLYGLTRELAKDPGVQEIFSLTNLRKDSTLQDYLGLYLNPGLTLARQPLLGKLFLSKDRKTTVVQILPRNDLSFDGRLELGRRIRAKLRQPQSGLAGAEISVGGPAAVGVDIMDRLESRFPFIIAGVVVVTYIVLLLTFNSWILPFSAIVLNALTVLGGYGALVLVFQEGWGAQLIGLPGAVGSVNVLVPLVIFCLVFGLSMDYEVFMISRIAEAHDSHRDTKLATAQGLAATARVITSAALIMVVVFGAFVIAGSLPIKMMGLGLAVAVFIDATLIRLLLVPALVRLAGQYNWVGPFKSAPLQHETTLVEV